MAGQGTECSCHGDEGSPNRSSITTGGQAWCQQPRGGRVPRGARLSKRECYARTAEGGERSPTTSRGPKRSGVEGGDRVGSRGTGDRGKPTEDATATMDHSDREPWKDAASCEKRRDTLPSSNAFSPKAHSGGSRAEPSAALERLRKHTFCQQQLERGRSTARRREAGRERSGRGVEVGGKLGRASGRARLGKACVRRVPAQRRRGAGSGAVATGSLAARRVLVPTGGVEGARRRIRNGESRAVSASTRDSTVGRRPGKSRSRPETGVGGAGHREGALREIDPKRGRATRTGTSGRARRRGAEEAARSGRIPSAGGGRSDRGIREQQGTPRT
ncbi:uncharacterized protein [Watersipora subatra]|uniref:uncharacterized protein n=1 Tax=Watersipora subatra TaxID=2589382 RepID=UPI00355C6B91